MIRLDIFPRLLPDAFCDTLEETVAEVSRRKASPPASDAVTRFDESPYGGYHVYTVSLEFAMETVVDMESPEMFIGSLLSNRTGYTAS